ncbi:MAG: MFS transporter [Gammaproteobacteria bacterium]|nr:MFS transporter [Gammaproteobacteria bacterium]MBV9620669.1 MFS transporter [Gammaproteobacteria bacterium]
MHPIRATWPLLLGMGILMLGAGLQSTLLGVRATIEAFPTAVTGLIMSCYYVGYLAGTQLAPQLIARVGPVRVFATLAALASVAVLVHGAWVHPGPWAFMRLLSGVCFAGIYVVAESWLNHRASSTNRGQVFALYMLVLYVGLGGAQFLLVLGNPQSPQPFMLVSALISAALVPIVGSAQEVAIRTVPQRVRFRDLYRNSPLGVVAVAISGMVSSIIFSMGPVYARLSGFGTRGVAAFMAVSIFAAVLTQYPVGRLSDRMDRRTVIASMCLTAAVVAAVIELSAPLPRGLFLTLAALFSGSALTLYSLSVSHVNDKLDPSQMVAASSALLLINGTAAAFGPVLTGALMTLYGARAYFGVLGALTATLTLFDLWRKLRRSPVPQEQKGPFINTRELVASVGPEEPRS